MELGRLEGVEVRTVWEHEARDSRRGYWITPITWPRHWA